MISPFLSIDFAIKPPNTEVIFPPSLCNISEEHQLILPGNTPKICRSFKPPSLSWALSFVICSVSAQLSGKGGCALHVALLSTSSQNPVIPVKCLGISVMEITSGCGGGFDTTCILIQEAIDLWKQSAWAAFASPIKRSCENAVTW